MNFKVIFISCLSIFTLATSCIKKEGADREADVMDVTLEEEGFIVSLIDNNLGKVEMTMAGNAAKFANKEISPEIILSKGATIEPNSLEKITLDGLEHSYVVTSEAGEKKNYVFEVKNYKPIGQDFEEWYSTPSNSKKPYDQPIDKMWDSGNKGIHVVIKEGKPYPTRKVNEPRPGSKGFYSVLLETTEGNSNKVSDLLDIPVFSGNMFLGDFRTKMSDPQGSPHFGIKYPEYLGKPVGLNAWYKYKAGSPYVSWYRENGKGSKIITKDPERDDTFDLYAVLYKVTKDKKGDDFFLTGHDVFKFDQEAVVAYTPYDIPYTDENADKWVEYKGKFTYKEELDFEKWNYKLAIVLASSSEGANYKGAIGSRLLVDDLRVVLELDDDAAEYK